MFITASLECGIEVAINFAYVGKIRFTKTAIQVEMSCGSIETFPLSESVKIRQGMETLSEAKAKCVNPVMDQTKKDFPESFGGWRKA